MSTEGEDLPAIGLEELSQVAAQGPEHLAAPIAVALNKEIQPQDMRARDTQVQQQRFERRDPDANQTGVSTQAKHSVCVGAVLASRRQAPEAPCLGPAAKLECVRGETERQEELEMYVDYF